MAFVIGGYGVDVLFYYFFLGGKLYFERANAARDNEAVSGVV